MSHGTPGGEADGKLDLVPLIDCVMLLLLFFILTSSFKADDMAISAILPKGGPSPTDKPVIDPPQTVRIAIIPADGSTARVRIGGGEEITFDIAELRQPAGPAVEAALDRLHAALAKRLQDFEIIGRRSEQPPVEIHCATRLPWAGALAVYDGVRVYEKGRLPRADLPLDEQRSVAFAAPVVRNSATDNPYDELQRLEHLR